MIASWLTHVVAPSALGLMQSTTNPAAAPLKSMSLNSPVWGYALMALLGGAILAVSLMPSKRGHQD